MKPDISVIMSVRDAEAWLPHAIESIFCQTHENFEFLITDDGSSDHTADIIATYAACDKRVRIFTNAESLGLPTCLNKMAVMAEGDYLARMDGDDVSHKNRFTRQFEFMTNHPEIDICFSDVNLMDEASRIICRKWSPTTIRTAVKWLPYMNYFVHPTAFIRKNILLAHGGYNEHYARGQDWELWRRMLKDNAQFHIIHECLLDYRVTSSGNSAKFSGSSAKSREFLWANMLIQNGFRRCALAHIVKTRPAELFGLLVRLMIPRIAFLHLVKFRSVFHNQSPQRVLRRQGPEQQ